MLRARDIVGRDFWAGVGHNTPDPHQRCSASIIGHGSWAVTTIVTYRNDQGVWIGADSQMIDHGRQICVEATRYRKWELHDRVWAIAGAGDGKLIQFVQAQWRSLLARLPLPEESPDMSEKLALVRRFLVEQTETEGLKRENGGGWDVEGLVVGPAHSWAFDGWFEFWPIAPGAFRALGSGSEYATGAWAALTVCAPELPPKVLLHHALATALVYDPNSGPPVWVERLGA